MKEVEGFEKCCELKEFQGIKPKWNSEYENVNMT